MSRTEYKTYGAALPASYIRSFVDKIIPSEAGLRDVASMASLSDAELEARVYAVAPRHLVARVVAELKSDIANAASQL